MPGARLARLHPSVVAAVPASQTGVASGMNANIRTIGGAVGTAVLASVVTAELLPSGLPQESGYTTAFLLAAVSVACIGLISILRPKEKL